MARAIEVLVFDIVVSAHILINFVKDTFAETFLDNDPDLAKLEVGGISLSQVLDLVELSLQGFLQNPQMVNLLDDREVACRPDDLLKGQHFEPFACLGFGKAQIVDERWRQTKLFLVGLTFAQHYSFGRVVAHVYQEACLTNVLFALLLDIFFEDFVQVEV